MDGSSRRLRRESVSAAGSPSSRRLASGAPSHRRSKAATAAAQTSAVRRVGFGAALREAGAGLVAEARLFDVYRGDPISADKVSYAYALSFQAADRTLTDAEVDAVQDRIVAALRARFNATLRGQG